MASHNKIFIYLEYLTRTNHFPFCTNYKAIDMPSSFVVILVLCLYPACSCVHKLFEFLLGMIWYFVECLTLYKSHNFFQTKNLRENLAFPLFGDVVLIVILKVKEVGSYAEGCDVLIIVFWRRVKGDSCLICWTTIKKSY